MKMSEKKYSSLIGLAVFPVSVCLQPGICGNSIRSSTACSGGVCIRLAWEKGDWRVQVELLRRNRNCVFVSARNNFVSNCGKKCQKRALKY